MKTTLEQLLLYQDECCIRERKLQSGEKKNYVILNESYIRMGASNVTFEKLL